MQKRGSGGRGKRRSSYDPARLKSAIKMSQSFGSTTSSDSVTNRPASNSSPQNSLVKKAASMRSPGSAIYMSMKRKTSIEKFELAPLASRGHEVITRRRISVNRNTQNYLMRKQKSTDNIPTSPGGSRRTVIEDTKNDKKQLGQWLATGICGNNITSSCLYVIALCTVEGGKLAPICLFAIAILLYLFRSIYTEVVSALPVNGGTYNLLLNTTTKSNGSLAACLTMLSYVTTAVISSTSAMRYVSTLFDNNQFDVVLATLGVLFFAAFLNVCGISESAVVALAIFVFHMASCSVLIIASAYRAISDPPSVLVDVATNSLFNVSAWNATPSSVVSMSVLRYNWKFTSPDLGIFLGLFYGFSSGLLGISGFESSSNFCVRDFFLHSFFLHF